MDENLCSYWRRSEVAQSCLTICDPIGCSLPGSSVHGIFQAIVLEWVAISFSRESSQPRARTWVSRIVDRRFTVWATREVQTQQRGPKTYSHIMSGSSCLGSKLAPREHSSAFVFNQLFLFDFSLQYSLTFNILNSGSFLSTAQVKRYDKMKGGRKGP